MRLRFLREGRLLVCSLLWQTVLGADYHDVRLANRQNGGTGIEAVTATVTIFTQFTVTETVAVTITPTITLAAITTAVSTESTTTTTTETTSVAPGETGLGGKRRRQVGAGPVTVMSTTTIWQFPDATETVTITVTDLQNAVQASTTRVTTEISIVTVEKTVLASTSSSSSSATASAVTTTPAAERPDPLNVEDPDAAEEKFRGVHLAVVLGAVFGSLVGAIALFVAWFLWMKKREEISTVNESEDLEVAEPIASRGGGGGGGGGGRRVTGLLGSVLGSNRSSTHYNTIPDATTSPATSPRLSPPQLPPIDLSPPSDYTFDLRTSPGPKLPALHISPPRQSAFACEYTFGSPVSSIGESQTYMSGSHEQGNWPQSPELLSGNFAPLHPAGRDGEQSLDEEMGRSV